MQNYVEAIMKNVEKSYQVTWFYGSKLKIKARAF